MKTHKKLSLNKQTVSRLNNLDLNRAKGGNTIDSICQQCPNTYEVKSCKGTGCCGTTLCVDESGEPWCDSYNPAECP